VFDRLVSTELRDDVVDAVVSDVDV
jgi:hypothetical protein